MASRNAVIFRLLEGEASARTLSRRELARLDRRPMSSPTSSSPSTSRSRLPRPSAVGQSSASSFYASSSPRYSSRSVVTSTNWSSSLKTTTVTMPIAEVDKKKRGGVVGAATRTRSPHSKLLRVCSERNANPHFAAIEADMLRLDWQHAMNDLVEDWSNKGRFDDFVELEGTVRGYVSNNMTDLAHYESECSREWEDDGVDLARYGIALSDLIRYRLFPYERVVTASVRHALSAVDVESQSRSIMDALVSEGITRMSTSGKLLDAMTSFDGTMDVINHDDIDDGFGSTDQHAACSRCFRLVVSGWSKLAVIGLGPTTKSDVRPEVEASVWAERWIDFCDRRRLGRGASSRGLILPSDEPMLTGVARMISSYARPREWHRAKAAHLNDRIRGLFSDK